MRVKGPRISRKGSRTNGKGPGNSRKGPGTSGKVPRTRGKSYRTDRKGPGMGSGGSFLICCTGAQNVLVMLLP